MKTAGRPIDLAVTDTHALVWWARGEKRRLGRGARRVYENVGAGRAAVYVPTLVLVEIGDLARRGILRLTGGMAGWTRGLLGTGRFFAADLTVEIVLRAETLYGIPERTDRLIAATAAELGYPLITRDGRIREAGVEEVW
jgi:PIN domain nuclease of toxin-antitoxin system